MTYADVSHARQLLGYNPKVSLEGGVRRFLLWYSDYYDVELAADFSPSRREASEARRDDIQALRASRTPEEFADAMLRNTSLRALVFHEETAAERDSWGRAREHVVVLWPQAAWVQPQAHTICFPHIFPSMRDFMSSNLPRCPIPSAALHYGIANLSSTRAPEASSRVCRAVAKIYAEDMRLWAERCTTSGGARQPPRTDAARARA